MSRTPTSFPSLDAYKTWMRATVLARQAIVAKISDIDRKLARAVAPWDPELARQLFAVADQRDTMVAHLVRSLESN